MRSRLRRAKLVQRFALLMTPTLAVPSLAQVVADAPPPVSTVPATVQGAQSFTPADFARFAPKTALDMVRQVPGFTIEEVDDRRGLGQASSNVLINGQRSSGKSNDAITELGRISAASVIRIDIVDGATLDVPGLTGQVANVITAAKGLSGSFAYRPQIRARRLPARLTNGEASLSGAAAGVDYTLSLANNSGRQGNNGPERVTTPSGALSDFRAEDLRIRVEEPRFTLGLKRQGADGSLANLNALLASEAVDVSETSLRSGSAQIDRDRRLEEQRRERGYELGGDYEFGLGGGRLKLIGLRQYAHETFGQTVTVARADLSPVTGDRFNQVSDEAETIARGEYRWKAGSADWQVSIEGALNILKVANELARLDASGAYLPVPLPNSAGKVEEKRAELTGSYGRPLGPELSVQATVGGEYSKLTQSGAGGLERSFIRPKGSVSLAWKASSRLDISAKLEREVGQLDFGDFVASANISAGTTNAGNPELVPPQSWNGEVEATRNFGVYGTATLRVYGKLITDIVDVVPIGQNGQAPGNLDRATVYGIEWKSTLNFDPFGLQGAKLDMALQFQKSSLDDPVNGSRRAISEDLRREIDVEFRHDLPGGSWAYGTEYEEYVQTPGFRLDQISRDSNSPGSLGIFVENKDVFGLTVRGAIDNVLGTNDRFDRVFFDGRRDRALLFTESRDRNFGPIFTVTISGAL